MRLVMRSAFQILILVLLLGFVAGGCARAQLHQARDNNKMLLEENQRLKRELDDIKGELNRTKIALDRANADLAATRK